MNVVFSTLASSGGSKAFSDSSAISRLVVVVRILAGCGFGTTVGSARTPGSAGPIKPAKKSVGTSTYLFVLFGSDSSVSEFLPRANYNIDVGDTFGL